MEEPINSHLACVWVDIIGALALSCMGHSIGSIHATGIAIHGIAHGALWYGIIGGNTEYLWSKMGIGGIAGLSIFFASLLKSVQSIRYVWFHSVFHATVMTTLLPQNLGFTYVQLALSSTALMYEIMTPSTPNYNIFACMVNLPVATMAWIELLACDSWYRSIGGHLLYDTTIVICTTLYCIIDNKVKV